jgi:hypothetical protein
VEEVVQDEGEWSIWEVDGEEEKDVVSWICSPVTLILELKCAATAILPEPLLVRQVVPRQ